MRENDIIAGSYRILQEIGKGGTGTVFLGYHLHLQKYVVLKETRLSVGDRNLVRTEADILKNLHHPYLPQVYDLLITESSVITVLDYVEGADLSKYACGPSNLSESVLLHWLTQMAEVLDYLHNNKVPIIHSDIKPGNVIVRPNGDICLIDFNISMMLNDLNRILGYSAQYASPEQYYLAQTVASGGTAGYSLDSSSDIYSTGATFYYLMTGIAPNCAAPTRPLSSMGDIGYSSALINIVDKCMQWKRERRYQNGGELLKAVKYYWKQDNRYKKMIAVRAIAILAIVAIIGGGIYGAARWRDNSIREAYRNGYAAVSQKIRDGDDIGAEAAGLEILGEDRYETYLKKNPKDYAELLHAMGDINYNRKDFDNAASYYSDALSIAEKAHANLSVYYRDYAITLVQEGKIAEAQELLNRAHGEGITDSILLLVDISCAYMQGEYEKCISLAEQMETNTDADADSIEKAEYFAALSEGNLGHPKRKVEWLKKASSNGSIIYLKMLADIYWDMAGKPDISETEKKLYAIEAGKIYKDICGRKYQSFENLMNLAIIQYYLQEYTEAQLTLEQCVDRYPEKYNDDHHISMYMAFLYEDQGLIDRADDEARKALEILEKEGINWTDTNEAEAVYRLHSICE